MGATSYYAGFVVSVTAGREEGVKKSVIRRLMVGLVFAVIAVVTTASCSCGLPESELREAVRGRLDLRKWDCNRDGPVELSGDWEFHWGVLVEPDRLDERVQCSSYLRVPGLWNGRIEQGRLLSGDGCATYRLSIMLPAAVSGTGMKRLAVMVPDLGTAYRLYLDGVPAGAGGVVGESTRIARPGYRPDVYEFVPAGDRLDIVLQISNFHHRKGGAWEKIVMGPGPVIRDMREKRLVRDFFLFGSIFIIGIYHLVLFVMRKKERSYLFFGLFCLLIAVRILATGNYYVLKLIPGMSWESVIGAEYLSFYAAVPVFFLFMGSLFPAEFPLRALRFATAAGAVFCGTVLLLPPRLYTHTMQAYQVLSTLMSLFGFAALVLAMLRKREGAVTFFAGFVILFITVINDFLQSNLMAESGYLVPFGLFVFIFSQSFLLSVRFSRAYDAVEKLSDELDRKHSRLAEISALKDEFLAAISHEIRTPLNGIIGLAESMIDGRQGLMGLEARYNLGLISASCRRLARLVNDIIDASRLRNHDLVLCRGPVDMRTVADIVLALARPLTGLRKIELFNSIIPGGPPVNADENRIQQVLHTIVANAITRTDSGHVTVSSRVAAGHDSSGGIMEIAVTDSGRKIAVDGEPDLLHDGGGRPAGSSGIGLSVARQIVELHAGTMRIEQAAPGARFSFTLPLYEGGESAVAETPRSLPVYPVMQDAVRTGTGTGHGMPLPPTGAAGHILIVDDDAMDRQVMGHYLAAGDFTAIAAAGGTEALEKLGRGAFDLVLLDIMMPGISGYDLCREIRKRFSLHELPVLVLTARYGIAGLVAGFESGANDYLVKPIHREELLARVRTLVSLKRAVRDHDEAKYKLLQERMNPHFLFNALNTVHALIRRDHELADQAVIRLADNYRFLIEHSFLTMVPFDEEWRFVENYLELEELRFRDSLAVSMEREGDFSGISIPPLTIQPLVENALKHGVQKRGGQGSVSVCAMTAGGRVTIAVADNGTGLDSSDLFSRSLGNIRKRLHHCFGEADIALESERGRGVTVTVTFPCETAAAEQSA